MCRPKSCVYHTNESFNILHSVSTVLGLYSGFSIGFRFGIPMMIKLVIWFKRRTRRTNDELGWRRKLKHFLLEFNLFKSAMHVEPRDICQQQWSTRLYILFLTLTLTIIALRRSTSLQVIQETDQNPSLNRVLELQKERSNSSLRCPCSQVSAPLEEFVEFNPEYHEVCSSRFKFEKLIQRLTPHDRFDFAFDNVRNSGPVFKVLQSFCELSKITVNNALREFYATQLITKDLLTLAHFMSRMNLSATDFESVTPTRFVDMLMLIRETTHVNQLINLLATNYRLDVQNDVGHVTANLRIIDYVLDINNQPCSGILNRDCRKQFIADLCLSGNATTSVAVDGFYASFYAVEALLLSQLQLLHNISFMHILGTPSGQIDDDYFTLLSQTSRFPVNATFASLVNQLFIESWTPNFNYTAYFEQCQPRLCSHEVYKRPKLFLVITSMIGLFGGLSALFQFVTPLIVTYVLARWHRQVQQEDPLEVVQRKGMKDLKIMILIDRAHSWKMIAS
jgi:hypothetical protein